MALRMKLSTGRNLFQDDTGQRFIESGDMTFPLEEKGDFGMQMAPRSGPYFGMDKSREAPYAPGVASSGGTVTLPGMGEKPVAETMVNLFGRKPVGEARRTSTNPFERMGTTDIAPQTTAGIKQHEDLLQGYEDVQARGSDWLARKGPLIGKTLEKQEAIRVGGEQAAATEARQNADRASRERMSRVPVEVAQVTGEGAFKATNREAQSRETVAGTQSKAQVEAEKLRGDAEARKQGLVNQGEVMKEFVKPRPVATPQKVFEGGAYKAGEDKEVPYVVDQLTGKMTFPAGEAEAEKTQGLTIGDLAVKAWRKFRQKPQQSPAAKTAAQESGNRAAKWAF